MVLRPSRSPRGGYRGAMAGGERDTTDANRPLPPAAKRKKATAARAKGEQSSSGAGRYTAPVPASKKGPSPRWVPVLMFALWGIGLGMILLNYMGVLPGSADGGNGWYLIGGLGLILAGIITATQYR